MALTRRQTRQKLYNSGLDMGFARTADAITAQGITDAFFNDDTIQEGQYKGTIIYRPNFADTSDNQCKIASIRDGDDLTHEGTAYDDDFSDLYYEVVGLLHPHELNEAIRLAPRRVYTEGYIPVTPWLDGDFSQALVTGSTYDWTAGQSNTVATFSTTGAVSTQLGQTGKRNLILTNSGANGYVPTSNLYVNPGDRIACGAIGRVNGAYTASVSLYDVTQSAALWTVTTDSRAFVRIWRDFTIPDGCNEVELRIGGVDADAVTEWDCLPGHLIGPEGNLVVVPSSISEQWRFVGFGPALYGRDVAQYVKNASSRQLVQWKRKQDFELFPLQEEANPYTVQIKRDQGAPADSELWIHALRPYSDFEELDNDTDTTNAPEDLYMAAVFYEVYDALHRKYRDEDGMSEWLGLRAEQKGRLDAQRKARPLSKPRPEQRFMQVSV